MTRTRLIILAAFGSAALLIAAWVFQAFGWAPCKMCVWQRWPHGSAVLIGAIAVLAPLGVRGLMALVGAFAALTTAGIGAYHSGVELKWWDGPASCSGAGNGLQGLSGSELVPGGSDAPALVMCDTLIPFFLGLTMANWNVIASLVLAAIWIEAARRA